MTFSVSQPASAEQIRNSFPRLCFVGPMLGLHAGFVPNPAEVLAPRLRREGYQCMLTSSVRNRYLRLADIVQTLIRRRSCIDVVCLQTYSGPSIVVELVVGVLSRLLGHKVLMVLHGGNMPAFMRRHPVLSKRALSFAHLIVTPSHYLAHAIEQYGFTARVIPNMVDLHLYPFRQRRQLRPRLLWMRTFHPIYNPEMAIDVLHHVRRAYPDATLTMAGQEKGSVEAVRQRVIQLGLQDHVRFAGFLNRELKQAEFAGHDIFLNTNRVDNMPVSVVEAGAFGLPIVATEVGGIPFLLRTGQDALLVPDENVEAMSAAVQRLLADADLAEKLSLAGRHLAEECDWSQVKMQWEDAFQTVMAKSTRF